MKRNTITQIIISILFISFISACTKEQIALNKLTGDWTYRTIKIFGITIDLAAFNYKDAKLHFDLCDDASLRCTANQTISGNTSNFEYDITNKGKTVNLYNGTSIVHKYTIKSLSRNQLVYSDTVTDGVVAEFTLER